VVPVRPVGNLVQPTRNVRLRSRVAAPGDADEAIEPLTEVHREDPQHAAEPARGAEIEDLREARDHGRDTRVRRREAARRAVAARAAILDAQSQPSAAVPGDDAVISEGPDDDGLDARAVRALRAYARSLDSAPKFKTRI
jgi:hypothetical protein